MTYISLLLTILLTSCLGVKNSQNSNPNSNNNNKSCVDLDSASCDQYQAKTCRFINNTCQEISSCDDLNPLGQSGCSNLAQETCLWADNKCHKSSIIWPDVIKNKLFDKWGGGVAGVTRPEMGDLIHIISGGGPAGTLSEVSLEFAAGKNEVTLKAKFQPTDAYTSGYTFTYQAIDIDNNTVKFFLSGTTAKSSKIGGGTSAIDLVEPFSRALMLYQKSSDEIYMLIVEKASNMPKFAHITKPGDFQFKWPGGDKIVGSDPADHHTAFVLKP